MSVEEPIASSSSAAAAPQEVAGSKNGRTMGKAHKSAKTAVRRSYISEAIKTPFARRMEEEQRRQSVKATEKEMKDDKEADRQMCVPFYGHPR
jgi:rRNA-processing protein CGR1